MCEISDFHSGYLTLQYTKKRELGKLTAMALISSNFKYTAGLIGFSGCFPKLYWSLHELPTLQQQRTIKMKNPGFLDVDESSRENVIFPKNADSLIIHIVPFLHVFINSRVPLRLSIFLFTSFDVARVEWVRNYCCRIVSRGNKWSASQMKLESFSLSRSFSIHSWLPLFPPFLRAPMKLEQLFCDVLQLFHDSLELIELFIFIRQWF